MEGKGKGEKWGEKGGKEKGKGKNEGMGGEGRNRRQKWEGEYTLRKAQPYTSKYRKS
jgi:hypothetical protein